jgi:hypothetical protein
MEVHAKELSITADTKIDWRMTDSPVSCWNWPAHAEPRHSRIGVQYPYRNLTDLLLCQYSCGAGQFLSAPGLSRSNLPEMQAPVTTPLAHIHDVIILPLERTRVM